MVKLFSVSRFSQGDREALPRRITWVCDGAKSLAGACFPKLGAWPLAEASKKGLGYFRIVTSAGYLTVAHLTPRASAWYTLGFTPPVLSSFGE